MRASVVIVTYNRIAMLRECMESVLANTGDIEHEIIVWDNASTDGTGEYLRELAETHPHLSIVTSEMNVGLNGVALGTQRASGDYIVKMDDDVVEVPPGWLAEMIRSFERVPGAGFLATNVVQDEATQGGKPPDDLYAAIDYGEGVVIEHGPAGGWCNITSRAVVDRIGGFKEIPGRIFFSEDGEFARRCLLSGLHIGIIRNVTVRHLCNVEMNRRYGYLDLCKLKYSDDSHYKPALEETLRAMAEEEAEQGADSE